MRKFIVILPGSNTQQQMVLHNHFTPNRAGWWHWGSEVWLLKFGTETPTVEQLREEIRQILPGSFFLVFSLDNSLYAGWGPNEWQQWFNQTWQ
jgi:hypothetical protein